MATDYRTHPMKPAPGVRVRLRALQAPVLAILLVAPIVILGAGSTAAGGGVAGAGAVSRVDVECQGAPATLVGSPGIRRLVGTDGDDVIVTGGSPAVEALAGSDLICVTGDADVVHAGEGDDSVVTSDDVESFTALGPGIDRFVGGSGPDQVNGGAQPDNVATGAGNDMFEEDASSDDVVDLGPGSDRAVLWGGSNLAGSLEGGTGLNTLDLELYASSTTTLLVDNLIESAVVDGVERFHWDNFRGFGFGGSGDVRLTFVGSPASERVGAYRNSEGGTAVEQLTMAGGDDDVVIVGRPRGDVDGGPGQDRLRMDGIVRAQTDYVSRSLEADLATGTLSIDDGPPAVITGMENFESSGYYSTLVRGDAQANRLSVQQTCFARVFGGPGADLIRARPRAHCSPRIAQFLGIPRSIHARGQRGADVLVGRSTRDRLFGGPGIDVADGRAGIDVCDAERRRRCERDG